MNEETRRDLTHALPSARARAVDILRQDASIEDLPELRAALQREPVAPIRLRLSALLRDLERGQQGPLLAEPTVASRVEAVLEENVVGWIRHELEPAIGWLRLAANNEIADFRASETNRAIESLRSRIDALESLLRATKPPNYVPVALGELVSNAARDPRLEHSEISLDELGQEDDEIDTDINLFGLILSNALRNAVESQQSVDPARPALVTYAVLPGSFWVRVTNQFAGHAFRLDEIEGEGVTGKIDHQGQGWSIMRLAAKHLGYGISVEGSGGIATFVLRGRRRSA